MFSPLPTPLEMSGWDRVAIDKIGIRGEILMENAGREAVFALLNEYGDITGKRILIIAGSGNNGGDGFVMGRLFADFGADVLILHTAPKSKYKGDAAYHLKIAAKLGVELKYFRPAENVVLPESDIIIDGLLGTGFEGELRPFAHLVVEAINRSSANSYIFSIDIPSGLNGLTGEPQPVAVKAHATVTFEEAKLGLALPHANQYTGTLIVTPIGIPAEIKYTHPPAHFLIKEDILENLPVPTLTMHKGTSGHVLLVGASKGLTGALHLAGISVLRAGAGLVTMACPEGLASEVKGGKPELMTMALGSGDQWNDQMIAELLPELEKYDSLVIGPGLGRDEAGQNLVEAVVENGHPAAVYDADALFALARRSYLMQSIAENSIFTPHPGEMSTLVNRTIADVESSRIETARKYAVSKQIYLILKGAGTVIGCPDGKTMISPISAPNLAAAGSGDILAGVIGALLARGIPPMQSACMGVYWHGMAGVYLGEKFPYRGNIATEIADMLPEVLKEELC
ncbi:bifunctional ADP-dependent NAD(P)H-hydrate dehydratase/NAD(P)H-hydrate epimerase [Maridesulfovibrio hydrothermalis]|uniref:Bifunctional NAD(P)H-hydrate repair enzyme n=1 Tax=Maridesulfovibrio hydrothermalis AM13 = DSM 14728 TaxID=1121451 RepID=L0RCQ3_9BACT|nr:bifunctional ADP-dependent NAD(P)H-hydrate dehydratase/NAD(P)H-hydrate epimerase [Maridesulfovibrio hydrothermalis]CCO24529.1 Carbohydrate kinase, YjeF related protein [Maridesulfovibrio hydrothermalis AM13 = DSM 14728]